MKIHTLTLAIGMLVACTQAQQSEESETKLVSYNRLLPESQLEPPAETAENIILLIGDGMGLTQVSSAFYYKEDRPNFHRFRHIGLIRTSASNSRITDSAAGATAFATGKKSYNGAIGVDADTVSQITILEILEEQGWRSGVIATSSITHATPASFYAHVVSRGRHKEIARDLAISGVDFFAGGGKDYFDGSIDGINSLENLMENGFEIREELVTSGLDSNQKYAFLLADDEMPPYAEGRGEFLPQITEAAITHLSTEDNGFFLMVEGSQIDWGGHANQEGYLVTELIDFDNVIGAALDFADADGNTLVVVTADHETGGYTLASGESYDDINGSFSTGGHSTSLIPVFAYGPGAELFQGIYENTGIFDRMMLAVGQTP